MLQLRQVQSGELLLRGMLLQATDNGRPEDLSVLQGEKAMTPFRTPFKAWLDMLAEINWEYELANPPMTITRRESHDLR